MYSHTYVRHLFRGVVILIHMSLASSLAMPSQWPLTMNLARETRKKMIVRRTCVTYGKFRHVRYTRPFFPGER